MIYLDNQATTPLAPEALQAMLPWLSGPEATGFANPHSPHRAGRAAAAAVEVAREQVAGLLPEGGRVIFTSGATEAINHALLVGADKKIARSAIEHAAVLDTANAIGSDIMPLACNVDGIVAVGSEDFVGTQIVAVMQVNNEIGTIHPVDEIAQVARNSGALFLCDAVQGAGKLEAPTGADLIAISAHKLYGPKGVGALWIRDGVEVPPLLHGGGQEGGIRSGTLSPALCAGFGAAASLARSRMDTDRQYLGELFAIARSILARWTLNGSATHRWPGNLNVRLDGLDVNRLMSELRDIAFSAGSACASGSGRPSHVLKAIGLTDKEAKSSIRLGFGRYTTKSEVETACRRIDEAARAQGA